MSRVVAAFAVAVIIALGLVSGYRWLAGDDAGGRRPVVEERAEAAGGRDDRAAAEAEERRLAEETHRLRVVTHPEGARVRVSARLGGEETGTTPFDAKLAGGHLRLVIERDGYNEVRQPLLLDRDRSLELWLDPRGLLHRSLERFDSGANPKQVAFSPDGKELWVSVLGGEGVQVFDARSGKLLDRVDLGEHGSVEVIFTRDGDTVFVSQMETASVYEIDRAERKVRRQLETEGSWTKVMALSPDERTLYAANWVSDDVSEIDLRTGKVRRRIPTVDTPRGLYATRDGKRLYVAGFADGEIARIDLASGRSKTIHRTGGAMRHLVGDAERGLLYADDMGTDEVFVVDLATDKVRKLASTDEKPNTMDLSPDGRVLYVSNRGENNPKTYYIPGPEWGSVLAIDTATGKVLDAIVGGNQTTGLDVSPDGRTLAFSDFLDSRVRTYAIPAHEVLAGGGGGRFPEYRRDLRK